MERVNLAEAQVNQGEDGAGSRPASLTPSTSGVRLDSGMPSQRSRRRDGGGGVGNKGTA